jgi:tetratricopeptide (TPR) repeat protein
MSRRRIAALCFAVSTMAGVSGADDGERLRAAKTLFFDRKYAEARQAWQAVEAGSGDDAEAAAYWIARCSENLKEYDRALREYDAYLARRPSDGALGEEARTSRVGLAARLYKSGRHEYLPVLKDGLADKSRTVRYYSALQLGGLGAPVGLPAVPVLRRIVSDEKDDDLVERAKLTLLKLDPKALSEAVGPAAAGRRAKPATWIRIRIYKQGQDRPEVSVNLPIALADMVFKSLPDDARRELKLKGYEPETFWEQLKKLGPTEILSIQGDDGERVQIWLE